MPDSDRGIAVLHANGGTIRDDPLTTTMTIACDHHGNSPGMPWHGRHRRVRVGLEVGTDPLAEVGIAPPARDTGPSSTARASATVSAIPAFEPRASICSIQPAIPPEGDNTREEPTAHDKAATCSSAVPERRMLATPRRSWCPNPWGLTSAHPTPWSASLGSIGPSPTPHAAPWGRGPTMKTISISPAFFALIRPRRSPENSA